MKAEKTEFEKETIQNLIFQKPKCESAENCFNVSQNLGKIRVVLKRVIFLNGEIYVFYISQATYAFDQLEWIAHGP